MRYQAGTTLTNHTFTGQDSYTASIGLIYYNARWYDPYLNRFIQADIVTPAGVQGLDRYAYANNNPVKYNDPSGHSSCTGDSWDDGPRCLKDESSTLSLMVEQQQYQRECALGEHSCPVAAVLQITFAAGIPTNARGNGGVIVAPLIYNSISIVVDKYGGVQIYGIRRDITFDPYFNPGPAEKAYPMNAALGGVSITAGVISGQDFGLKGTKAYGGPFVDTALSAGSLAYDHFDMFDTAKGAVDPSRGSGDSIGLGWGMPISGGTFATFADEITPRFGFPIP